MKNKIMSLGLFIFMLGMAMNVENLNLFVLDISSLSAQWQGFFKFCFVVLAFSFLIGILKGDNY